MESIYSDDGPTLKQVLAKACRKIDLGAAVLPKPLLLPDVDEFPDDDEDDDGLREGVVPESFLAASEPTRYARVLSQEFNAIVVEHHLKWAPMCVSILVYGLRTKREGGPMESPITKCLLPNGHIS
jgi:hypothetical protein